MKFTRIFSYSHPSARFAETVVKQERIILTRVEAAADRVFYS